MAITAEEFAHRLRQCAPGEDELVREGLEGEEIEGIRAAFFCVPREDAVDPGQGEVRRLLALFDCDLVEVTIFRFGGCPRREGRLGHVVAVAESDPVVVDKEGVVLLVDHATGEENMKVAVSESCFLEGVACLAEAFRGRTLGTYQRDECVDRIVDAVGGGSYACLWESLLPLG